MTETERIHAAVQDGDDAAVRALLARDPSLVRAVDVHGKTPLHLAAEHDHAELAALLLEAGADPEARADPALHDEQFDSDALGWAREGGHARAVALLAGGG